MSGSSPSRTVTAETLAAALHEQGIGCLQPTALSRDVCRPDKNAGDFHNEAARAILAALPVSPTDGLDAALRAQRDNLYWHYLMREQGGPDGSDLDEAVDEDARATVRSIDKEYAHEGGSG